MNKVKCYISADPLSESIPLPAKQSNQMEYNDFNRQLSNRIKKFNSERNLFLQNLYNDGPSATKNCNTAIDRKKSQSMRRIDDSSMSRVERTKSFFRNTLVKRWKSSKDVTVQTDNDVDRNTFGCRKNIVTELRRNFENLAAGRTVDNPLMMNNNQPDRGDEQHRTQPIPFKKCEFSAVDLQKRFSLREPNIEQRKNKIYRHSSLYHNQPDLLNNMNKNRSINDDISKSTSNLSTDSDRVRRNNLLNEQKNINKVTGETVIDPNLYEFYMQSNVHIRKCTSVTRIDLDLLRNELDDVVDPKWPSMDFSFGYRSWRGGQFNGKELDLEQKIDLEIKMREGSAKLLAACNQNGKTGTKTIGFSGPNSMYSLNHTATTPSNSIQMLEAAKNLLTSNERMTAYMAELQRRKRDRDAVTQRRLPTGRVSLNEIRMPLMWRDSDHFKNKGDHRRFAVFCLAKIGTEIYDTSMLCPIDRNLTDVSFNDAILFTNVTPDFELKLDIYACMLESDLSIASTPRKIKNTIHSSISRTVGKRLAANLKDELNTKIGPKFDLIATAHLTLSEASDLPHTHDLCLSPNQSVTGQPTAGNKLPLFGHFCCRLAVQPDSIETATCSSLLCHIGKGPVRSIDGFARLQAFKFELWDDEQTFEAGIEPRRSVAVQRDTKLKLKGDVDLYVGNMEEGRQEEYHFRAKSVADATKWYSAIKRMIREHQQWEHVPISGPMSLAMPGNGKNYYLRSLRQGSLYDQVPIMESDPSSCRPTVHDIFAIPNSIDKSPTLNDFRMRANSSGRSSSHSSSCSTTISAGSSIGSISSRKSHWPFGK